MAYARSITTTWDAARPAQRVLFSVFVAAVVLVLGVFYVAMPLGEAIARAESDVARSHLLLDVARARVNENASLARSSPVARSGDLRVAVDRVMSRYGLQSAASGTKTADGRTSIVIAQARFDALVRALEALAHDEGIQVVEATLTALVDPGSVRADLSFQR